MDYAVILCTPYVVRRGLVDDLLAQLNQGVPHRVVLRRRIQLSLEDVVILYPKLTHKLYFPKIMRCLTCGEAEFILVAAKNVHERINNVKGEFRYEHGVVFANGLRKRYLEDSRSFEFIFHATDSNEESDVIGIRLFGSEYVRALHSCYPCLGQ